MGGQSARSGADWGRRRDTRVLRLDTLVRLRWLAVAGQTLAILIVAIVLRFPMPIGAMLFVIGLAVWLNIALRARFPASHRIEEGAAFVLLATDVVQLTALLYLTGGLQNPFAFLFLAPVMISATTLSPQRTIGLGLLAMAAASLLAVAHLPLPWYPGETLVLPPAYIAGVWTALLLSIAFIGVYAWRVSVEGRQLADALAATEFALVREQHLSQLDGLAAAAAHQLGTPLSTITIIVNEIDRALPADHSLKDDIGLLKGQAQRCRDILSKISSLEDENAGPLGTLTLAQLVEEVATPHRHFGIEIVFVAEAEGGAPEPTCPRNAGVMYGLGNLIENAVDFARSEVVVTARWSAETVAITIGDDGPGFATEIIARLGEPYLTTRGSGGEPQSEAGGLGLGLFIAKTLLERSGASFKAENVPPPKSGARVILTWPRHLFEGVARKSG